MRIGLDLRSVAGVDRRRALALEADRLGLWALLIGDDDPDEPGTAMVEAAALAPHTSAIHLAPVLDGWVRHPLTLAEELSVLDHLSARRGGWS
ncbi:MAG: LLM class flavin-dependent oxidoreductase [Actinomycetota bacterium]